MGILEGKRILVTGVLTDDSLAFGAARLAQEQGAEVALTGFGRGLSLTNRAARKLPAPVEVYELDATVEEQANLVATELESRWGALDGVVHAIGYAPDSCLGNGVLVSGWKDVATALEVSTFSLKVLAAAFAPLLSEPEVEGRSLASTSTPAWPGPATTGWAWRKRPWSRSPATSPETWAERHPGQPHRGWPDQHSGGQVDPQFRTLRECVGRTGPAWLGRPRLRGGRTSLRGALVGLVPTDHRRNHPRRRRVPRHRRLTIAGARRSVRERPGLVRVSLATLGTTAADWIPPDARSVWPRQP